MRTLLTLLLLTAVNASAAEKHYLVLASTRTGRIEAFSRSLGRLGAIGVNEMLESVSASPDGHTLFLGQQDGLYALDMEAHRMCPMGIPASFAVPAPEGHVVFIQTPHGVETFDAASMRHGYEVVRTSTPYNLQPSPDGKWILGINNAGKPTLDIFSLDHVPDQHLEIPAGPALGAWGGTNYYIFSYLGYGKGHLWSVNPGDKEMKNPKDVQLPDLHGGCNEPVLLMLAGADKRLFLTEAFGYKLDRRSACPGVAQGGIYSIDPSTGQARHLAASLHVNRMVVTPDGDDIYVIRANDTPNDGDVRLVHLDSDGRTLSTATLESGDWNLTLATTPDSFIPRGYVRAALSCTR